MNALEGKRVLVVDDEALIALFAEEMLLELGATPVGPAMSLEAATVLVEEGGFDAAILDVNLDGATSEVLARRLISDSIPFVIVTGYGRVDWEGVTAPILTKPYDVDAISKALGDAINRHVKERLSLSGLHRIDRRP